jgi:hypothetical protein
MKKYIRLRVDITPELDERYNRYVAHHGSKTYLIRRALIEFIDRLDRGELEYMPFPKLKRIAPEPPPEPPMRPLPPKPKEKRAARITGLGKKA